MAEYQHDLAGIYRNLALFHCEVGEYQEAEAEHQRAIEIITRLLKSNPGNVDCQIQLANSRCDLGSFYRKTGQVERAIEECRRAVNVGSRLAAETPGESKGLQALARCYYCLGLVYEEADDYPKASEAHRNAIATAKQVIEAGTDHPGREVVKELVKYLNRLGALHQSRGKSQMASDVYDGSLETLRRLTEKKPGRRLYESVLAERLALRHTTEPNHQHSWALYTANSARAYTAMGNGTMAESQLTKAIGIANSLHQTHPDQSDYAQLLSTFRRSLGVAYYAKGDVERAEAQFRRAIRISEHLVSQHSDRALYQEKAQALTTKADANGGLGDLPPNEADRSGKR